MQLSYNYHYQVDYDTYGDYSCSERGCDDEGICRCFRISEVEINSINLMSLTTNIFDQLFPNKSDKNHLRDKKINSILFDFDPQNQDITNRYCIYRILVKHKIYETDKWYASWSGGYYGDEVDDISIEEKHFEPAIKDIEHMISLPSMEEKINFILTLEYGKILDKLIGKKYQIEWVSKGNIVFGQENHLKNVLHKTLDFYSDSLYQLPRGISYFDGEKFRIVDGYHRVSQTKKKEVWLIVAK